MTKPATAAKRAPVDWVRVRAEFEAKGPGSSFRALGEKYGVSHTAIRKRAEREAWKQDLEGAIRAAVTAQVSGVVSTANPEKTQEAVESEAARRVAVIQRHRQEWGESRERILAGLRAHKAAEAITDDALKRMAAKREGFEDLKAAKIAAEALAIVQQGERKAHRLDDPVPPTPGQPVRVIVEYSDETPAHLATDGDDD